MSLNNFLDISNTHDLKVAIFLFSLFLLSLINLILIFTKCFRYDDSSEDDSLKITGGGKLSNLI